jgi:hypothetical protein
MGSIRYLQLQWLTNGRATLFPKSLEPSNFLRPNNNASKLSYSYQLGTVFAEFCVVNLVDLLITYLAIGAAFAMRAYFRHRHRPISYILRSVVVELAFWLPKWVFWSIRKISSDSATTNSGSKRFDSDHWYAGHVDALVEPIRSPTDQKRFREAAERYVALRTALSAGESEGQPEDEFELFDISGHRNNRAGTSCLYRKNLTKLRNHSFRSAEDLVRAATRVHYEIPLMDAKLSLIEFFDAFDDVDAVLIAENFELFLETSPVLPSQSNDDWVAKAVA